MTIRDIRTPNFAGRVAALREPQGIFVAVDNADVIVFVTSALRYADEVPWQVLRRAISRGTPVIHVLNRVGSSSSGAVIDFKSRLAAAGLEPDPVTVPEHHLSAGAQRVPSLAVRALQRRLGEVVTDKHRPGGHPNR